MSLAIETFLECKNCSRGTAFYGDNRSTWESDYERTEFEFSNKREDRVLTLIDDQNEFNELQAGKKYRVTFEEIV